MKLKNLQITNFRCFESLSMDLDGQLTVLVAKNGQGKSSILDAIRIGLWSFLKGFDLARNPSNEVGNNISVDDVRMLKMADGQMVRQLPAQITLTSGNWLYSITNDPANRLEEPISWSRIRTSEAKGSKTKDDENSNVIEHMASIIQNQARSSDYSPSDLFVFGYYGTGRLWNQKKLTKDKKQSTQNADFYMRLFAYRDCLDPASSYKHFEEWFIWICECYWEDWFKQKEKGLPIDSDSKWKNTISVVQQAINDVLQSETGWHNVEYGISDERTLFLNHPIEGKLKVAQLSDGIRNTLAMVGDIAYRCVKLNWHLGLQAAKETHGIVMIDEIEMHLHPAWQQSILGNLCKAFPNIQFIVTTHSPQVLSAIHRKSIRLLGKDINGKDIAAMPLGESYGQISSDVLESIMHVNPQPPISEKADLQLLTTWVDQGRYHTPESIELFAKLKKALGDNHSQLQRLARSINRQEILKNYEANH